MSLSEVDVQARITPAAEAPPRGNLWTFNFLSYENRTAFRTAPLLFGLFIAVQLLALWAVIRFFFRETWDAQVAAGIGPILITCLVCNVVSCFGEYLFHRYLLHIETVRFLGSLCASHRTHHKLTSITFNEREGTVRSLYPILDLEHDDQSTFPPWALLPFFAFFTPFFAVIAFSFPHIPVLIGGYLAIAIAHFLYEVIHAVHHQPFEPYWTKRLARPVTGRVWKWLYGFHQAHHVYYKCNLNVAGLYGIPLADIVLGTYKPVPNLFVDGASATKEVARELANTPRWPISAMDRAVFKRRRWMVKS